MTKAASQPDAQQLLGRETERKALLDVLERVSKDRAAGTVSIVGASGQGKTALLAQFIADAVARRWTVFNVVAHESQSNVPLAAVRRLLYGIVDQLGVDIARRYVSGLEHDLFARDPVLAKRFGVEKLAGDEDIYRFQRSFVALLEGMLLDLPIVLAVDDVQWIDGESLRTLKLAIADLALYPLLVAIARRPGSEQEALTSSTMREIRLESLRPDVTRLLVARVYPEADEAIIDSIVECAQGLPYAVVSLASEAHVRHVDNADELRESVRAVVSAQMSRLDPGLRQYLEVLSLTAQPLSFKVAGVMAQSNEQAMNHLAHLVGSFLVADEGSFQFPHALVCDAVRSLVPFPEALHRRIVETLLAQPNAEEDFLERIIFHARACGEVGIEYEHLLKMARTAIASSAWLTAESCFSRALELKRPPLEDHIAFYTQYGLTLRVLNRDPEIQFRVLDQAIRDAGQLGIRSGFGALTLALVWTVVMYFHDWKRAKHIYEHLLESLEDERDRWELRSIWAHISADRLETGVVEGLNSLRAEELPDLSDVAATNFAFADLMTRQRLVGHSEATDALNMARVRADTRNTHQGIGCMMHEFLLKFYEFGVKGTRELVPDRLRVARVQWARTGFLRMLYWSLSLELACGNFTAVVEALRAAEVESVPDTSRGELCALAAMVEAFTGRETEFSQQVRKEVERAMLRPDPSTQDTLIVAWAATEASRDGHEADRYIGAIRSSLRRPVTWWLPSCPAIAVLYAQRAGNLPLLEELARGEVVEERSPWHRAHDLLMAGSASMVLGSEAGPTQLMEAADTFTQLGAAFYAAYARGVAAVESDADRRMLRNLGVVLPTRMATGKKKRTMKREATDGLTFREQEIAGLVAEGKTNREIATGLFLSERTIEAHLASIFRKLDVTSRVQVARWNFQRGDRTGMPVT